MRRTTRHWEKIDHSRIVLENKCTEVPVWSLIESVWRARQCQCSRALRIERRGAQRYEGALDSYAALPPVHRSFED